MCEQTMLKNCPRGVKVDIGEIEKTNQNTSEQICIKALGLNYLLSENWQQDLYSPNMLQRSN